MEKLLDVFIKKIKIFYLLTILIFIFVLSFIIDLWLNISPDFKINKRISSNKIHLVEKINSIDLKGSFTRFRKYPELTREVEWGNFRGPDFNNIANSEIPLKSDFNEKKLPIKWSVELGEGYAGPAIANGIVYITDHDKKLKEDVLRAFSLETGLELWRHSYKIVIKRNHGITRTVPAVNEKYIVSLGPKCQVICLNSITGEYKWGMDLQRKYNTEVPLWYTGQCPLIYNNMAILAPAGDKLIIGVDLESGEVLFETENQGKYQMSHASITPMKFYGKNIFVYTPISAVVGISADKENLGEILFVSDEWEHSIISPSPVFLKDNLFLLTAGYGGGSKLFKVNNEKNNLSLSVLYEFKKNQFACEQHTPIFINNHLYTIMPNDAGELKRELICMDLKGELKWRSGKENRFGLGPFIIADNKFFILNDNGILTIAEVNIENYNEYSEIKILNGRESWGPIAVAGSRLLFRDFNQLVCLDLKDGV